jgi:hypothetical protein
MAELTFLVEDAPEGGFTARAEGFSIFAEHVLKAGGHGSRRRLPHPAQEPPRRRLHVDGIGVAPAPSDPVTLR